MQSRSSLFVRSIRKKNAGFPVLVPITSCPCMPHGGQPTSLPCFFQSSRCPYVHVDRILLQTEMANVCTDWVFGSNQFLNNVFHLFSDNFIHVYNTRWRHNTCWRSYPYPTPPGPPNMPSHLNILFFFFVFVLLWSIHWVQLVPPARMLASLV